MPNLVEVWNAVKQAYVDHRINSERCLQAIMYQHLLGHVDEDETVLVEPIVDVPDQGTTLTPDLVLRDHAEVTAFFEIKCAPHAMLRDSVQREHLDRPDVNTWIGRG